jgi:hypothetical protein
VQQKETVKPPYSILSGTFFGVSPKITCRAPGSVKFVLFTVSSPAPTALAQRKSKVIDRSKKVTMVERKAAGERVESGRAGERATSGRARAQVMGGRPGGW